MKNQLAIFLDHSEAILMTYSNDVISTEVIRNDFDQDVKEEALSRNENLMHNKRQQYQAAYYKKIENVISKHSDVLLFGPTDAKIELHNILKEDGRFDKINVEVRSTDKLTENQKHAFVKNHFSS